MPRRRPSEVRTQGSACGTHRAVIHYIPGLGRRPMAAVISLEHTRMWPGAVATALAAWQEAALTGTADNLTDAAYLARLGLEVVATTS